MEKTNYYNLLSVITGVVMIVSCCSIAYFFQKNLFSKYRNKAPNIVDENSSENP